MARRGLLIITSFPQISSTLRAVKRYLFNRIYVQIYSPSNQSNQPSLPSYSRLIAQIYASSLCHCTDIDVRVIIENLKTKKLKKINGKIDSLLFDCCFPIEDTENVKQSYETTNVVQLQTAPNDENVEDVTEMEIKILNQYGSSVSDDPSTDDTIYDNVVLGGTFDRIHIGHKILLTEAVIRAKRRVVVGVTDDSMIQTKKLRELIEPVNVRIDKVREFLNDIDSTLEYEVVPIQDAFGPTRTDPTLNMIIVSDETKRGGEAVNKVRSEANLPPLAIRSIELIECSKNDLTDATGLKEDKISSSNYRIDLLGTVISRIVPKAHLPKRPYIIGLVGGIATGKSDLSQRLQQLGAQIINCDKLAHELYEPNRECYENIIKHFGDRILNEQKFIDRMKLGAIVFGNVDELQKLNEIVWPILLKNVKTKIMECYEQTNCDVIILEAAVLLKAGWQNECHEIWSTILPREEALKRLMARNNLTASEAEKRINSQDSNESIVKQSNVVFSSQFGFEFTQIQVERAWKLLMNRIETN